MTWVDAVIVIAFFFSFVGGLKEGVVKSAFSLVALVIAMILAGFSYQFLAGVLSFLPGKDWENFIGFILALSLISLILHIAFLLPRVFIDKAWIIKGPVFRLAGGLLNVFGAAVGTVVFALLIQAYPVFGWLEEALADSTIVTWLMLRLEFVQMLLPPSFGGPAGAIALAQAWLVQ